MEYITLKNSDLKVSRFCMGGCPMGGYGWGNVQEQELIDAVHTALYEGVTFFDTAETYGLGQSEMTLGKALGDKRKDVVISDKFGVRAMKGQPTVYDNGRDYIIKACEGSLKRLGTDYIDVYTIHYRDGKTPLSDVVETLEHLKNYKLILNNPDKEPTDGTRYAGTWTMTLKSDASKVEILEISISHFLKPWNPQIPFSSDAKLLALITS